MSDTPKKLTWWEPAFGEEEAQAVADVVRSGYVNEGPRTAAFTDAVAGMLGARHVLATCNGTVALFLALRACGVEQGDDVIVPDVTFAATATAAALAGARPVPVDVRLRDLNIDPEAVEAALTPRTRAVVAVHVNGRPADMPALRHIADAHGLALVEDAAQALGSTAGGRALGTLGDAASVSLAPTKIITSAQGGLVITDRDEIRDRVVRLKDHGRLQRSWNHHPELGFNFKFSDVYAALAEVQFSRLPVRIERARRQYRLYEQGLADLPGIRLIDTDIDGGTVPLWVDLLVEDAEGMREWLAARGIDCRPLWPALHTQPPFADGRVLPNGARVAEQGVWLPSGEGKCDDDIARVVAAVREWATSNRAATGTAP